MSRFIILGSSNAVPKQEQDNAHLLISSVEKTIMVDCGDNPVGKVNAAGFSILDVTDLVLTHFHADHVGSLPLLIQTMWLEKRETTLTIHGLEVTLEKARKLLELFSWQNWKNMFPVNFNIIPDEGAVNLIVDSGCQISALPMLHLIPSIGIRVEFKNDRIISYSSDTEPCENLIKLAAKADVLIQESAGGSKGHTSAAQAGKIATEAGVKKLILIHFERRTGESQLLSDAGSQFNGEVLLAQDMMEV